MTHYELEVLGGDWGLASLQPASLAAVAYARMAGRGSSGSGSGSVSLQCVRRPLAVVSAPYPTLACGQTPLSLLSHTHTFPSTLCGFLSH